MRKFKKYFVVISFLLVSFGAIFAIRYLLHFLPKPAYSQAENFSPIIITAYDAVSEGHSVFLTFDHKNLVEQEKSTENGDNLRIYYDFSTEFSGNQIEIDRLVDNSSAWNTNATKIWFKLQSSLSADSVDNSHYRIYFGQNLSTIPLQDATKIYEYWDDFDDGNLADWLIDAGVWSEENGFLKAEGGGAQMRNSIVDISDAVVEAKINFINPGQYVGIFTRSLDSDYFYLFDYDGNASDWRLYRNLHSWTLLTNNQNFPAPKNNDILSIRNVGNFTSVRINNQDVFSYQDTENVTGRSVGLFVNGGNSYTEFSYFLVRKAVENEPVLTLGPEFTPSPTSSPTLTPTPTITPILLTDGPKILSAETQDVDKNGKADHLKIIFDKDLNGSTVTNADFTISSYLLSSNPPEEDMGVVTLQIVEGVYFDTGSAPEITLREHGVKDLAGNWNSLLSVKSMDKIGPYIIVTNPNKDSVYSSSLKISGIASDFSSSEDAIALDVKLFYKESSQDQWQDLAILNNDSFLEPFEWSFERTSPSSEIFDLKITASDLNDNITELILNNVVLLPTVTSTPTPTLTPVPTLILTVMPTVTPTPTPIYSQTIYNTANYITTYTATLTATPSVWEELPQVLGAATPDREADKTESRTDELGVVTKIIAAIFIFTVSVTIWFFRV